MNKRSRSVADKKPAYKTPNTSKMQEVIIDMRTRIYIEIGADPEEARNRYIARMEARG